MGLAIVACSPKEAGEATAAAEDAAAPAEEQVEAPKTAKDYVSSKALTDSASYLLGINYGQFLKQFDFGKLNYSAMLKGIKDFVNADGDPMDPEFGKQFKIDPQQINDVLNKFLENRRQYLTLSNIEEGKKFLDANKKKLNVVETASGLQYQIIEPGSDKKAGPIDSVKVNYKGTLLDGTVFDETKEEPVQFSLNRVIPGWTEGMQLVGEGGKIKLFVPASLAYGEAGTRGIAPNSTLIFDVEVIEVHPYVDPAPAEAVEE